MEELTFRNGDVLLWAVASGPADGPVILLLHGFPEFWYGWRRQIEPLAQAGYRVVVPDQRGYSNSSKPAGVKNYALRHLASDVIAIIDGLGCERVILAGHDWGAVVAWSVAAWYPQRLHKLIVINVPHPDVMQRFLLSHPGQLLRSWYVFFFQIPRLPEALFAMAKFRRVFQSLQKTSRPGTFTDEDFDRYQKAWSRPGAATGMINWYRALLRHRPALPREKIRVPVLIIWGRHDHFLMPELAEVSAQRCAAVQLLRFDQATHWVQHEEAGAVNRAMLEFAANS